jgi:glycine/D-amino acid oxidase-like deaminating enzyme/nitrite reductase/ring-hydroxylating ferredoxin subunit
MPLEDDNVKTVTSNHLRTSGKNITYWINSVQPLVHSKLNRNDECDVVVVGGGMCGIITAYQIGKEGKKVILIEDGFIGSGESGRTTAHLSNVLEERYKDLNKYFSDEEIKLAAESHTAAIDLIEQIKDELGIDCDFMRLDGYLFPHHTDSSDSLDDELEAARKAGLTVEKVGTAPGITAQGPFLKFSNQAQFHPMKFMRGVCAAIERNGGEIFASTHVSTVNEGGVKTETGFTVKADAVVVATFTPINDMVVMHTKQAPYRTYVVAAKYKKGKLPEALWWDSGDKESKWSIEPYHYVRTQTYDEIYNLLIVGGEDHKTGQSENGGYTESERFNRLEEWMIKNFPHTEEIVFRWSGQIIEPVDTLAFIGKNPMDSDNIYIITGHSGNGMTTAGIAGLIIPDLIVGRKNKFADLYDPSRKNLGTIKSFIEEQANVVKQYADYLTKDDLETARQLKIGDGAIMRKGGKRVAVFKDETSKIHAFTAICPHMKCILHWNGEEKTFDCPCHGSRFSCYGKVINGPANSDLDEVEVPG